MSMSLVSVIIPTRNRKYLISRAVNSVLAQSYQNIELIVINDASEDGTYEAIRVLSQKDSRIIIFNNETRLGLTKTLNKAIKYARGKYIARLDDEDFWCDKMKIEKQVNFLDSNKDYGLVGGGAARIDEERKEISKYLMPKKDEDIRKMILQANAFVHVAVLFRKDVFEQVGGYDIEFDGLEDWDLWLKIGKVSKFYNFPEYFVFYIGHTVKNPGYVDQTFSKIRQLKLGMKLKIKHRKNYSGFLPAFMLCFASYFYAMLPYRQTFWPVLIKLRSFMFRQSVHKYYIESYKDDKKYI